MLGAILASTLAGHHRAVERRRLDMEDRTRAILVVESAISDVLSIVVALALLQAYKLGNLQVGHMAGQIVSTLALAAILRRLERLCLVGGPAPTRSLEIPPLSRRLRLYPLRWRGVARVQRLHRGAGVRSHVGNIESFHRYPGLKRFLPAEPITMNEPETCLPRRSRTSAQDLLLRLRRHLGRPRQPAGDLDRLCHHRHHLRGAIFPAVFFSLDKTTPRRDMSFLAVMAPKGLVPSGRIRLADSATRNLFHGDGEGVRLRRESRRPRPRTLVSANLVSANHVPTYRARVP